MSNEFAGDITASNDYRARIADADEREEAGRLYVAWEKAEEAFHEIASNEIMTDEHSRKRREMIASRDKELTDLAARNEVEREEICKRCAEELSVLESKYEPADLIAARKTAAAAEESYNNHPGSAVLSDDENNPCRCLLSGVVLYEDDELIHDEATGGDILRHVILPPVEAEGDEEEAA